MIVFISQNLNIFASAILVLDLITLVSLSLTENLGASEKSLKRTITYYCFSLFLFNLAFFSFQNGTAINGNAIVIAALISRITTIAYCRLSGVMSMLSHKKRFFVILIAILYGAAGIVGPNNAISEFQKIAIIAIYLTTILVAYTDSLIRKRHGQLKHFDNFLGVPHFTSQLMQWMHRAFGPIIVEWITLRAPAGLLIAIRLVLRIVSYASLQRTFATSIALAAVLLAFFLRT